MGAAMLINGATMTVDGILYTWDASASAWTTEAVTAEPVTFYVQELTLPSIQPEPEVDE